MGSRRGRFDQHTRSVFEWHHNRGSKLFSARHCDNDRMPSRLATRSHGQLNNDLLPEVVLARLGIDIFDLIFCTGNLNCIHRTMVFAIASLGDLCFLPSLATQVSTLPMYSKHTDSGPLFGPEQSPILEHQRQHEPPRRSALPQTQVKRCLVQSQLHRSRIHHYLHHRAHRCFHPLQLLQPRHFDHATRRNLLGAPSPVLQLALF